MKRSLRVALPTLLFLLCGCQAQVLPFVTTRETPWRDPAEEIRPKEAHHYYYYPATGAYFCDTHQDWWILEDGVWTWEPRLPTRIPITPTTPRAEIAVVDDAPWLYVKEHRRRYPPTWIPAPKKSFPLGQFRIGG